MLAYLRGEPGAERVAASLSDPSVTCYAHAINLAEVYYDFLRRADDMGRLFWQRVAHLKAHGRLSLADCCCLALAQTLGGTVVTSDHREFDPFVPLGLCPILFIR